MGVHAGKFDRRVNLWKSTATRSLTGQENVTWGDEPYISDLPAAFSPSSGGEGFQQDQRVAENTFNFRIRYPHAFSIDETMQIEYEGDRFEIINVDEDPKAGRRVEMVIRATRKDNQ